ncbi:MAG: CoA-binding protein [bacterium]|nr:MAG: CoA-binding protein [bacterium]
MNKEPHGAEECSLPDHPNDPELIRKIFGEYSSIAVVGLSGKPDRDSYRVAAYLKDQGYRIIPVNPRLDVLLGEKCRKSLGDVPLRVDVVNVFRKPSALPELADEIIAARPRAVWFQIGVVNNEAAKKITDAGIDLVQNVCMKIEHQKLKHIALP